MKRRIVQISTGQDRCGEVTASRLFALCNDGTLWRLREDDTGRTAAETYWAPVKPIPQRGNNMSRDEFWLRPMGATGATGIRTYNRELDISIGCLIDLLLHDASRLTSDDAQWFRSRLTFIKQAWEHQNGKQGS